MRLISLIGDVRRYSREWTETRGWGPFKRARLSPCSAHQAVHAGCELCEAACWENLWILCLGHALYVAHPRAWRWWANVGSPCLGRWHRRLRRARSAR